MTRITLARGHRSDLSRPSKLFLGGNTCLFEEERVIVQKLASGMVKEIRLARPAGEVGMRARAVLRNSEIRYDDRAGVYMVRVGNDTWLADLPERVVAPATKLLRSSDGCVRLSAQVVSVGPSRTYGSPAAG